MAKLLFIGLFLISLTLFIWTLNYINETRNSKIPTIISAFNA